MKTILHITECLGSGVLYYIKNISSWQVEKYHVIVAYSVRPETPKDFKKLFDKRVEFVEVEGFTREINPVKDLKAFCSIKRIVRNYEPHLVHLHSTKAGILGRWAINCNKTKVLYSPHAYSFLMMNCNKYKRNMYKFFERISDRKGCLTIADINGELEQSREVTKKAICIPNGIDCDEFDRVIESAKKIEFSESLGRNNEIVVCMMGKIVPQKNPMLFNNIAKRFPNLRFVWVGDGELRDCLDSTNITVTGWLSRAEAVCMVMHSDIFLFTSEWESLSIALIEAMYIGKPCIVSNADGNRDVVESGRSGYVCYSLDDYIKSISALINDAANIKKMGEEARQAVINKYNTDKMEMQYRELFESIGVI